MNDKRWAAFRPFLKEALWLAFCLCLFALALSLPIAAGAEGLTAPAAEGALPALTAEEEALLKACQSGEIIRLHVLANDDSPQAQLLKLQVRDALLDAFGRRLAAAGAQSAQQVYALLLAELEAMTRTAQRCAMANGFGGSVSLQVGLLHLPEKTYGRITLPEGDYRGLRVTLGSGEGRNWWCILFPRLCLALADTQPSPETDAVQTPPEEPNAPEDDTLYWESQRILANWPLMTR